MANWYPAHNYTPADDYSLQAIPNPGAYTDLETGDMAFVYSSGQVDAFVYDSTSSETQSIPLVVTPDGNSGNGRWLKTTPPVAAAIPYTSSGGISVAQEFIELDGTAGALAMTYAAPVKGKTVVITCTNADNDCVVTLTSGDFYFVDGGIDDSGNVATFNTAGQTLVLFGISATAYVVVQNSGAVGIE